MRPRRCARRRPGSVRPAAPGHRARPRRPVPGGPADRRRGRMRPNIARKKAVRSSASHQPAEYECRARPSPTAAAPRRRGVVHHDARHRWAGAEPARPPGFDNLDRTARPPRPASRMTARTSPVDAGPHQRGVAWRRSPLASTAAGLFSHARPRSRSGRAAESRRPARRVECRRAPPSSRDGQLGSRYRRTRGAQGRGAPTKADPTRRRSRGRRPQ